MMAHRESRWRFRLYVAAEIGVLVFIILTVVLLAAMQPAP
jgi:hypothetical protein